MPDLFGIDIAGIVASSLDEAGGLLSGTLTQETAGARTAGSLTGGTNPTEASAVFQGFLEEGQKRLASTRVTVQGSFVTMIGASITPALVPEVNDTITLEDQTYKLEELVSRDPAAATYVFKVVR